MASKKAFASMTEADLTAIDSSIGRRSSDSCNSRSLHSGSSTTTEIVSSLSCVTRETSREECATHRFIVWAAVKRNSCQRMSASERLECPLLRCRRRFADHELMLRHLAGCEQLTSCEYWCYDCMRVERFNDSRCKRCLGHPSKRRKMLSMAKSFFSHLGHKSRKGQTLDYEGEDASLPPPSYDSLEIQSPVEAELQSNEIVEIDSTEITTAVMNAPMHQEINHLLPNGPPPPSDPVIDPQALLLSVPELDSTMIPFQSSMNWQPTPPPIITEPPPDVCISTSNNLQARLPGMKPTLQVNTHGLGQYRHARPVPRPAPTAPRSKNLSPSSSVRSTTSTMSNISSIISPISAWSSTSNAWSGTCLTSPSGDLISPGGFLPNDTCAEDMNPFNDTCPTDFLHEMFSELPADIPAILPSNDISRDDLLFSMDANPATSLGYAANVVLTEENSEILQESSTETLEHIVCGSETQDLVSSLWDMLQEHIVTSLINTQHIQHNPLAEQLKTLSAKTIATNGLRVLRNLLDGQRPRSAVDTLCFVHVVYSFSLVMFQDDAVTRSDKFFAQSLSYARYFAPADQILYKDVAVAIWRPDGISREHLATIMNTCAALERTPSVKGKGRQIAEQGSVSAKDDALLSAARSFLDELEASVILNEGSSHELLTTELWAKHHQLSGIESSPNSPFAITVGYIMNVLDQTFSDFRGLSPQLKGINHRVMELSIQSVRRVELEIIQAGKNCMPSSTFFDDYVPQVRSLCDPIYKQHDTAGVSRRNDYYGHGITLIESIVTELDATPLEPIDLSSDLCLDEFLTSFTDDLDEDFLSKDPLLNASMEGCLAETTDRPSSTGSSAQLTNDTTTATTSTAESSPSYGQAQKIEAHSCCEICGYRPKGDPQWFKGSMAKHKKLQHSTAPPKIYKCPFPGCNSQYRNRPDNLRQHQIEKNHFVSGDETVRRPSKRKKME